jgi:PAS domain S-box-containing protein
LAGKTGASRGVRVFAAAASSPEALADRADLALVAVERTRMPMVIADARQADNPIVLANQSFLDLTGYTAAEVIGRNCRFLQGPESASEAVAAVRRAVETRRSVELELLNYRKDGSTFWNALHLDPVFDESGELAYFFASQRDVTEWRRAQALEATERRLLREVDHRAMNALSLVQGIVRLTKAETITAYAASIQARVATLARTHAMLAQRGWTDVPLAEVVVAEAALHDIARFEIAGPEVLIEAIHVQSLALALYEVAANAAAHGSLSRAGGRVAVAWRPHEEPGLVTLEWKELGRSAPPARPPGFGGKMIDAILKQQLRGAVQRTWSDTGLELEMTFPGRRAETDLVGCKGFLRRFRPHPPGRRL